VIKILSNDSSITLVRVTAKMQS